MLGHALEELQNRRLIAGVEQAVGLVQDEDTTRAEIELTVHGELQDANRRSGDDVHAVAQLLMLRSLLHAADEQPGHERGIAKLRRKVHEKLVRLFG